MKEFEKSLKLTEEAFKIGTDSVNDIVTDFPDAALSDSLGKQPDHRLAQGPDMRRLRALLERLDPDRKWGGLELVQTPEGHYLWLCPEHAQEFKKRRSSILLPESSVPLFQKALPASENVSEP
jgi:internalin A